MVNAIIGFPLKVGNSHCASSVYKMVVSALTSKAEFDALLSSGDKVVVFFWAAWHEPSKQNGQLQGIFQTLSDKYTTVKHVTVEAEAVPELSELLNVTVVPTFVAYNGGAVHGRVEGVFPAELSNLVKALNAAEKATVFVKAETSAQDALNARLTKLINTAPVMLFMKGTPAEPRCGFSRQIVTILKEADIPFASFDILTDEEVRAGLKVLSDWPTYPQLYVNGTLAGGLDIIKEMQAAGDLKEQLGISSLLAAKQSSLDDRLKSLINTAPVMLFMKGSPAEPRCGFSRQIVAILKEADIAFSSFDILTDEEVRAGLKVYSDWPTYPQLYVNGVLMGGLDIVKEMQQSGDLKAQFGI